MARPSSRARRRVSSFGSSPRGETQEIELLGCGGVEEVALVASRIQGAVEAAPAGFEGATGHVMAGRQHVGIEVAGGGQKIAELDRAVALDAGDRRLAGQIALGETVDHRFPEAVLVIEDVVRDAERLGDPARIVNVLARAAGTLAMDRRPMVVELQRDPDDIVALLAEQACHHGGIYAAGHGDDDTCLVRGLGEVEGVHHVTGSPAGRSARICGVYSDPGVELPGTREAGLAYRSTEPGKSCRDGDDFAGSHR